MRVLRSTVATRRFCRNAARPLVLVPTMGALHAGHAALMDRARKVAGRDGTVVTSIFVNPAQFGPKEDFGRYPRTFPADRLLCDEQSVDVIFHPAPEEMYAVDFSTWVNEDRVSANMCGGSRPGHFRGVCTVVLKLLQIVQPDAAVFGLKDLQQCMVVRRMVRDLNVPVKIVLVPTVRERDGLALSSRNVYLTPAERAEAPILRQALLAARAAWSRGVHDAEKLRRLVTQTIVSAPLARIDYVEIANADSLEPVKIASANAVIAVAVYFGRTRLIDNIWLR